MANKTSEILCTGGVLRAAINLGNPLLVSGRSADGQPLGIAIDMATAIADALGAKVALVSFNSPGEIADAVDDDMWDICLMAIEPKRAEKITFSKGYVEIEATYLVPQGSPLRDVSEVDAPGTRIAVADRSAYDLFLSRTLKHAELCRAEGLPGAYELFVSERLDALAGLKSALIDDAAGLPGSRVLEGEFNTVQQAIGTQAAKVEGARFLEGFVAQAVKTGFVQRLIDTHGMSSRLAVGSIG